MVDEATIFVVDDDPAMRESLRWLIGSVGLGVETFATAEEFLQGYNPERLCCLVVDVRMPGMSGLDLQARLVARGAPPPIIFITGYGEVPVAVRALKRGAVDFLEKPFSDQVLLDHLQRALDSERLARQQRSADAVASALLSRLTPREREVMDLVMAGQPNKVIANQLGLSPKTVEVHRAQVMRRLEVGSVPALVRLVLLARGQLSPV